MAQNLQFIDRNGNPYNVTMEQDSVNGTLLPISGLKDTAGNWINPAKSEDVNNIDNKLITASSELNGVEQGLVVRQIPKANNLCVKGTSTAGVALTVTLPAPGVNLFHYIDRIIIQAYTTVARVGTATPITVTTTNIQNLPSVLFSTAAAIGTIEERILCESAGVLKSLTANTATTIVCPATASVIWNVNVFYRTGN